MSYCDEGTAFLVYLGGFYAHCACWVLSMEFPMDMAPGLGEANVLYVFSMTFFVLFLFFLARSYSVHVFFIHGKSGRIFNRRT